MSEAVDIEFKVTVAEGPYLTALRERAERGRGDEHPWLTDEETRS